MVFMNITVKKSSFYFVLFQIFQGLPRIYISANSGARIGLAEEVRHLFKVAWVDPNDLYKGLKYIYLTPHDYKKVITHF